MRASFGMMGVLAGCNSHVILDYPTCAGRQNRCLIFRSKYIFKVNNMTGKTRSLKIITCALCMPIQIVCLSNWEIPTGGVSMVDRYSGLHSRQPQGRDYRMLDIETYV